MSDVDHLGLEIGESLCLRYVLHGEPVTDAAVLIGHHSEFAVLDVAPNEKRLPEGRRLTFNEVKR